jgi:hypothetical protein
MNLSYNKAEPSLIVVKKYKVSAYGYWNYYSKFYHQMTQIAEKCFDKVYKYSLSPLIRTVANLTQPWLCKVCNCSDYRVKTVHARYVSGYVQFSKMFLR